MERGQAESLEEREGGRVQDRSPDGLTPKQLLKGIRERVKAHMLDMYGCLDEPRSECLMHITNV